MSRNPRKKKWKPAVKSQGSEKIIAILTIFLLLITIAVIGWWRNEFANPKPAKVWYNIRAPENTQIRLPTDDAPHKLYTEWWYYNGHLYAENGNTYSFHYAVFLLNGLTNQLVVHGSLTDHQSGRRFAAQKRTGGNPSAGANNGFRFHFGDWEISGSDGKDRLKIATERFSYTITLDDQSGPVYQGENGLLDFDKLGMSFYYSRPRMAISGLLKLGGPSEKVTGQAWFDHQWGDFRPSSLGWDWFALQLDNGADIMLYKLYDNLGKKVLFAGTYTLDGVTRQLTAADFETKSKELWKSQRSNITYPINWSVTIPRHNIDIDVTAYVKDCEFDSRLTTYNLYWEGAVEIKGSHEGVGFVELSGYKPAQKPTSK